MRPTVVLVFLGLLVASTGVVEAQHAEPAKATTTPHAAEPTTPAASAPATDPHTHPAAPAARPATGPTKSGADAGLSSALLRIQERIDHETATPAKPGSTAARRGPVPPAAPPAARTAPTVTLRWRTTLTWPAELTTIAPAVSPATIELLWK